MKTILLPLLVSLLYAQPLTAQTAHKKISNIELLNLDGESVSLPYWGEKNLVIFYVDPDRHSQNYEFTLDMEKTGRASGDNIIGLGVMNLKDAPMIPNGMARSIAKKRTKSNDALVFADEDRILSQNWGIGDCNNMFVLLLVSKESELVFMHKGMLTKSDIEEFYDIVQEYR